MRDPDEVYESVKDKVLRRQRKKKILRVVLGTVVIAAEVAILVIGVKMLMHSSDEKIANAGKSDRTEINPSKEPLTRYSNENLSKMYFPEGYTGYRYPVLPLMTTWPYGNHGDMVLVCQIPEDMLATMSTEELLQTVLTYPLWSDSFAWSSMEAGHEVLLESFNGLAELCKREDRIECLLQLIDEHEDWFQTQQITEDYAVPSIRVAATDLVEYYNFGEAKEEVYRKLRIDPTPIDMRDVNPDTLPVE